jgi:ABC-type antimicrobial peptide transport system permease subunit
VVVGSAIGGATAAGVARAIKAFLFGVETTDPAVFLFAIALLAVASVCAGYIPARRAARVDPMVALRHE